MYFFELYKKLDKLEQLINSLELNKTQTAYLMDVARSDTHHELMTFILNTLEDSAKIEFIEQLTTHSKIPSYVEQLKEEITVLVSSKEAKLIDLLLKS
ncbi:MAG: hypothetical protein AAB443_02930 [Patescibacteria group bacterium]